jgi:hypothetical protein
MTELDPGQAAKSTMNADMSFESRIPPPDGFIKLSPPPCLKFLLTLPFAPPPPLPPSSSY